MNLAASRRAGTGLWAAVAACLLVLPGAAAHAEGLDAIQTILGDSETSPAVSYTHLTLPTSDLV